MIDLAVDEVLATALRERGWPVRPLTGQPLAVDLLDTRWVTRTGSYDVLDDDGLTQAWLADRGHLDRGRAEEGPAAPPAQVRACLRRARAALAAVIAEPADRGGINAVLDRGRVRVALGPAGPIEQVEVPDAWRAAWSCARDLVELLGGAPGRVRRCANPDCPLHFLDTSRTGDRRWCSMAVCGNRSKARRHRDRAASTDGRGG